jgi:preprotein translocase subunit YajC
MNLAYAADVAYAADAPGGALAPLLSNPVVTMLPLMFAIVYFIVLRPQQKQKAERDRMLGALKKGDRVVTTSGMHGTVIGLGEHTVTLRVTDQVKLEFDRSAIGRVMEVTSDKDA